LVWRVLPPIEPADDDRATIGDPSRESGRVPLTTRLGRPVGAFVR
jgi:hypothetical protein